MFKKFLTTSFLGAAAFAIAVCYSTAVRAEFIVQVGSAAQIGTGLNFNRGTTGNQIEIWGYSDVAIPDFSLYGLTFDVGTAPGSPPSPDGAGYSPAFNFSADFTGGIFAGAGFTTAFNNNAGGDNYDLEAVAYQDTLIGLPLTANVPVKLFTLSFDIDSSAAPGEYSFVFRPDATLAGSPANQLLGTGLDNLQMNSSGLVSFTVAAVPEPTSLALVGLGLAGYAGVRRRRKKQIAAKDDRVSV